MYGDKMPWSSANEAETESLASQIIQKSEHPVQLLGIAIDLAIHFAFIFSM